MSELKTTPAPWEAREGTTTGAMVVAPKAPKSKRAVCRNGGPDREANANLIAAAPDLYEALEVVMDDVKRGFVPSLHLPRMEAALAKARGKQS